MIESQRYPSKLTTLGEQLRLKMKTNEVSKAKGSGGVSTREHLQTLLGDPT